MSNICSCQSDKSYFETNINSCIDCKSTCDQHAKEGEVFTPQCGPKNNANMPVWFIVLFIFAFIIGTFLTLVYYFLWFKAIKAGVSVVGSVINKNKKR